jgi:hypothetical protein
MYLSFFIFYFFGTLAINKRGHILRFPLKTSSGGRWMLEKYEVEEYLDIGTEWFPQFWFTFTIF